MKSELENDLLKCLREAWLLASEGQFPTTLQRENWMLAYARAQRHAVPTNAPASSWPETTAVPSFPPPPPLEQIAETAAQRRREVFAASRDRALYGQKPPAPAAANLLDGMTMVNGEPAIL